MSGTTVKQMLFNNGEGVDQDDFNNLQGFLRSQLFDTLGVLGRTSPVNAGPSQGLCYAVANGGACYGKALGKVGNAAGVILQLITAGAVTGDSPNFQSYYLAQDELLATLAANSSGNPRIDIGVLQLTTVNGNNEMRDIQDATTRFITSVSTPKRANSTCTFQVVQGTPGSSPVAPSVPSGYVQVWSCLVANGFDPSSQSISADSLADYRMPLGTCVRDVIATDCLAQAIGTWTPTGITPGTYPGTNQIVMAPTALSGGVIATMLLNAHDVTANHRLIAINVQSMHTNTTAWQAEVIRTDPAGLTNLDTITPSDLFPATSGTGVNSWKQTIITNPIWGNAFAAGYAEDYANPDVAIYGQRFDLGILISTIASATDQGLIKVRFIFAGGLS